MGNYSKGFTLIELLGIIAILALILLIAVPIVLNMITIVQTQAYHSNERMLEKAASIYMTKNATLTPTVGQSVVVTLDDLVNGDLVKELIDVKNSTIQCDAYVEVSQKVWKAIKYDAYIDCGSNYTTQGYDGLTSAVVNVYGDGAQDYIYSTTIDTDGYVAVGSSDSNAKDLEGLNKGSIDAIAIKYDIVGNIVWQKNYGGLRNDYFYGTITTADGYVAVGTSNSIDGNVAGLNKGGSDAIIVKYDKDGNIVWKKNYGGTGTDNFRSVYLATDGYIVVGDSGSTNLDLTGLNKGGTDAIIVKYDTDGNVVWKKNYGGTSTDNFYGITINTDDTIITAGRSYSSNVDLTGLNKGDYDGIVVKYDASGNVVWKKNYGGTLVDNFLAITILPDGIAAVGYSTSTNVDLTGLNKGGTDATIVKYDFSGNLVWNKNYGGTGIDNFYGATYNGISIVTAGNSDSTNFDLTGLNKGGYDGTLVLYDSVGNISLQKNYGGTGVDTFQTVASNGTVLIASGYSASTNLDLSGLNKGYEDGITVKYDNTGTVVWKKNYGGGPGIDVFYSSAETNQGYVVAGYSNSVSGILGTNIGGYDGVMIKYNYSGNITWLKNYGGTGTEYFYSTTAVGDGTVAVGLSSSTNGDLTGLNKGGTDAIIVKYDDNGNVLWKKNYGGSLTDTFYSVSAINDGIIAVGYSVSINGDLTGLNKGGNDAIVVKYDLEGNIIWQKNYGGTGDDQFRGAFLTNDGYIIAGHSTSTDGDLAGLNKGGIDSIIVKYDFDGNVAWKKNYGGTGSDYYMDVREVDDYYYAAGYTGSTDGDIAGLSKGGTDAIIVKYDSSGNISWQQNYGGTGSDYFYNLGIKDGNVMAVGRSNSTTNDLVGLNKGTYDATLVQYDTSGTISLRKNYGGSSTDYFYSVCGVRDGLVMVGYTSSSSDDLLDKGSYYNDAWSVSYK